MTAPARPLTMAASSKTARSIESARRGSRRCLFDGAAQRVDTPVYDWDRLAPGHKVSGPALIDDKTTTVLVVPGFTCEVDSYRNLLLRAHGAGETARRGEIPKTRNASTPSRSRCGHDRHAASAGRFRFAYREGAARVQIVDPAERVASMLRIRRFEEQCIQLARAKRFPGHYHVYIGQEATAVAACAALGAGRFRLHHLAQPRAPAWREVPRPAG